MKDRDFQIATGILDDCRRLIAAGKAQRWDIVKWGIAVNLGLATAAFTLPSASPVLVLLGAIVAWASVSLVEHYNSNMTDARLQAMQVVRLLKVAGVDWDRCGGVNLEAAYASRNRFDKKELWFFVTLLAVSPVMGVLRWLWWVNLG